MSGMHSPENGGPEMLIELAYRLIVEESPFIQNIRNNVITFITPVIEVDGREKQVDTYYFNKKRAPGDARLPLMYWGKYVQHDNNRDGMGQLLKLTQAITDVTLTWRPTIIHDLHEAQTYLYSSTGTGPYNDALDPITVSEWWMLAQNDVLEMTKRGVPGVWTYGFYDGWVPNYMIFIAHSHNAIGRFYEVQGYGPDNYDVRPGANVLSKEWFRPNPPLPFIKWGPRNNTNIQQSAVLFSLSHVAKNRQLYLENYWLKNKRSIEKGKNGPVHAWVIPAGQRRKSDTAAAVNDLRRQGLEISRATRAFKAGGLDVQAGDYVVRGDQPFRTLAEMYFSIQNYPPQNPAPYDDTGWTFQLMRDLRIVPVTDKSRARSADDAGDRRRQRAGRRRRHGPGARRRAHGRQQPGDLPLQERRRQDARRRGGLRSGWPPVPRRLDHRARRRPRAARADAAGARAFGLRHCRRRRRCGPTISTCRASATCTAGRARRTRAGGGRRSTRTGFRTPTSPTRSCARATFERSTTSFCFPTSAGPPSRRSTGWPGPARRRCPTRRPPRRRIWVRSIRATTFAAGWASRAWPSSRSSSARAAR